MKPSSIEGGQKTTPAASAVVDGALGLATATSSQQLRGPKQGKDKKTCVAPAVLAAASQEGDALFAVFAGRT